ncbi:MAG: hypothetical protein D8M57_13065 [Candidatus Scalindua sp. AMX11]|nr:MAG: hypothetical protein DWQ00_12025 [Candidatus Scalindua sp.]NOG83797.1 hypothetical protein [Planctomycetota bacterium]RZV82953.1 MAG: hypothetical protein EX341_09180 [Candidatus Scalindua sp. SCAELEC01]TDE64425.1 MAG: hypothetical protein D8M57_13065 [Candidatus Scalindua sp. AMX11]GJQ59752.1 MAG: hypothetical protein SCALA701_25530 [Candidatus Scalindua sp.]
MLITLDEETHIYRDENGRVIPSVTQIINAAFPFVSHSNDGGVYYRERGKAVHLAIHYIEKGTLDPSSVEKEIWPYIKAYFQFKKDFKHKTLATEERVYHKTYDYCGTLDRRTRGAIWDYKTGVNRYVDGLQLCAYSHAKGMPDADRYSVYLRPTGKYKIESHERDRSLFPTFLACKQIYQVKNLHGLLNLN